jgi:colicin import membrane protein
MSMSERARTGLREMPSNAAWLLSRALKPAESLGDAAHATAADMRDRGRKASAALVDAAPVGGDSVDIRMKRAREAAERARDVEQEAVEASQAARGLAEHARKVSERGQAQLAQVERETDRQVKQRVGEAQKAADEAVRREREEAEADAEEQRQQTQAEVDEQLQDAEREAEEAQARAEELIAEATERLAEARRLAGEATDAARAAADEAHRQARELADEAEQQASDADARIEAAEQLREHSEATAKSTAQELKRAPANGELESYNKPELVDLASSMGIEGRTTMTKAELVDAIAKASRTAR